jgi:Na+-transporting methylmalonyl-CoA/oxaloacetate decarboxylase gamma subunit
MCKAFLIFLILALQGCSPFHSSTRRPPPPAPPPATVLIEKIDDTQFIEIDKNKDGKLDKSELQAATSKTDEWGATKIFLILVSAIAVICLAPLAPLLVQKVINKCKSCESEKK